MDILISNSGEKPIYEQITDQVREQIMSGTLAAGEALPSMRLLARELRISVITTKRAYEELEQENAELRQNISQLGTEKSIRRIAAEELGLVDPEATFFEDTPSTDPE